MSAVQFTLHFVKLAALDQLGAQLGLPAHPDRAPAVVALLTLMLRTAHQAMMDLSGTRLSDIPARS
ncbi:MAG TPA: hypothetical protein VN723_15630 [Rhizomicrobium sp.]|jgi:hypothetical protein|nr:hypothetical protein [Rhizomicrobium sp.]